MGKEVLLGTARWTAEYGVTVGKPSETGNDVPVFAGVRQGFLGDLAIDTWALGELLEQRDRALLHRQVFRVLKR